MRHYLSTILLLTFSSTGFSQYYSESDIRYSRECSYERTKGNQTIKGSCGSERITGVDNRIRPPVYQPAGPSDLIAVCGSSIPSSTSYKAVIHPLTCGEGAMAHDRIQTPVDKKIMDQWGKMSRSGLPNAEQKMQEIRKLDLKYEGEIEYPTWESWTYQQNVGDFSPRCGYEKWDTTCEVSRSEEVTTITYTDVCEEYEIIVDPEPTPSPSTGGGGSYTPPPKDSYRPDRGGIDTSVPERNRNKGETSDDLRDESRKRWEGGSILKLIQNRQPAGTRQGACKRWGKQRNVDVQTRTLPSVSYRCLKERAKFCTWFEPRTVVQRCNNQKAKYTVEYARDPKWTPGYKDAKAKYRDFNNILPNKFDLLAGETETFVVYNNFGENTNMQPRLKMTSEWNEYTAQVSPQVLTCAYKKDTEFKVSIHTVGRKLVKAPNPLALPVDQNGNEVTPLTIENGRPVRMTLLDKGRATQLKAAELSRTFAKPDSAPKAQREVVHKKAKLTSSEVNGLTGDAYWHETQFRIQLYEKGRWNRTSYVTVPTHFGSNQGNILGGEMNISLTGQDGIKNFYRSQGPFHRLLGWLWEKAPVDFTPGQTYFFQIQALPQGLPFYDNGCKNGEATCDGENAEEAAFSTPLIFQWKAPEDQDNRGFFKHFRDFQKIFKIL